MRIKIVLVIAFIAGMVLTGPVISACNTPGYTQCMSTPRHHLTMVKMLLDTAGCKLAHCIINPTKNKSSTKKQKAEN